MKHLLLLLLLAVPLMAGARDFSVVDFGARGDGTMLCTSAIQHAIDYASSQGGGRVVVPKGTFLSGGLYLKEGVELHLRRGAVLLGSTNVFDYQRDPVTRWHALIHAVGVAHIAITGKGEAKQTILLCDSEAEKLEPRHQHGLRRSRKRNKRPSVGKVACNENVQCATVQCASAYHTSADSTQKGAQEGDDCFDPWSHNSGIDVLFIVLHADIF